MSRVAPIEADGVLWAPLVRDRKVKINHGQYCRWVKDGVIKTEKPLIVIDISRSEQGEDYLYVVDIGTGYHTGIPVSEIYVIYEGEDEK